MVVIGCGGLTVSKVYGIFGSGRRPSDAVGHVKETTPFDPNKVLFENFCRTGAAADIRLFDLNLGWLLSIATTKPANVSNILAQSGSEKLAPHRWGTVRTQP